MNRFIIGLLLGLASAISLAAQVVVPIYTFTNAFEGPKSSLVQGLDGNFYGTTYNGGSYSNGVVYCLTTNGIFNVLTNFNGTNGANPEAALLLGADGNFYGSTVNGGTNSYGTLFRITTNGDLTTLVNFNGTNGANPYGIMAIGPDGNFYGTTASGGTNFDGNVFCLTTNGSLSTLVNFNANNGDLINDSFTLGPDGAFYGVTTFGGPDFLGTIYRLTLDGTLTTLTNFDSDNGGSPWANLALGSDGNFYGTTESASSIGSYAFRVTTNGLLTLLRDPNATAGEHPFSGMTLAPNGNLYGAMAGGGIQGGPSYGNGTIYRVTTNGVITNFFFFNYANGSYPASNLTLGRDGNFYGTTDAGGSTEAGLIYELQITNPPVIETNPLTQAVFSGTNLTLSVAAWCQPPPAYQWEFDSSPIANATNSTLTLTNATPSESGSYSVIVTNIFGAVTSSAAYLAIVTPQITALAPGTTGAVMLSFAGLPNASTRLWMATNLTPPILWVPLWTNTLTTTNGTWQFTDTNTLGMPDKYYRFSTP